MCTKVEQFIKCGKANVSFDEQKTSHPVHFSARSELQKWLRLGYVDFAELFRGFGELTIRVREAGCSASEGFDKFAVTYERCWCLDNRADQCDCAWLLVYSLKPKVVHLGTPCTNMSRMGQGVIDAATKAQNEFTIKTVQHQETVGLGASVENPKSSSLVHQPEFQAVFGSLDKPKPGWSFYRSEGCQFKVVYPGRDEPGRPMNKACFWIANFDLSSMELRCRIPAALMPNTHEHRHIRGTMYVDGVGSTCVAAYTGRYVPEQGAVYAKACRKRCDTSTRNSVVPNTALKKLADNSTAVKEEPHGYLRKGHGTKQFLLREDDRCIDLCEQEHRSSPLQSCEPSILPAAGAEKKTMRPVDQFHKVTGGDPGESARDNKDISRSAEAEAEARKEDAAHEKNCKIADAYWSERAKAKDWGCVNADLSVYRYCGVEIKEDPRRTPEYKAKVVDGLGFGKGKTRPGLTEADMEACREVLGRKASAFWVEGTPRTALRYLLHDTIPTGPPCRTPPHRLKGEEAEWVDEQLQSEVISGQLIRGNSEWASPPFATKAFAEHRMQRKRRLVVDYRRVNQRILRAVYFVRSADGVVHEVSGSML